MARKKVVENLDKLNKVFKRAPKEARTEIAKALRLGSNDVVNAQKALAPTDDGDLRDSIRAKVVEGAREIRGLEGNRFAAKVEGVTALIMAGGPKDTPGYYARWVEFGTNRKGGEAQPFFFPGYRLVRNRVKGRIRRAIKKAAKLSVK